MLTVHFRLLLVFVQRRFQCDFQFTIRGRDVDRWAAVVVVGKSEGFLHHRVHDHVVPELILKYSVPEHQARGHSRVTQVVVFSFLSLVAVLRDTGKVSAHFHAVNEIISRTDQAFAVPESKTAEPKGPAAHSSNRSERDVDARLAARVLILPEGLEILHLGDDVIRQGVVRSQRVPGRILIRRAEAFGMERRPHVIV